MLRVITEDRAKDKPLAGHELLPRVETNALNSGRGTSAWSAWVAAPRNIVPNLGEILRVSDTGDQRYGKRSALTESALNLGRTSPKTIKRHRKLGSGSAILQLKHFSAASTLRNRSMHRMLLSFLAPDPWASNYDSYAVSSAPYDREPGLFPY
jgi:hypothetical protein